MKYWDRIIDDYKRLSLSFPNKELIVEFFNIHKNKNPIVDFPDGYSQTIENILETICSTRRMYEENTDDKIRLDLWSIHLQAITMLENVLLINSKKISS